MGCISPVCTLFCYSFFNILEYQCFILSWAHADATAATGTIHRANLNTEGHAFKFFAVGFNGNHTFRFVGFFFCVQHKWTYAGMWANIRALVTLDTIFWLPLWNINGNHAFFITGSTHWGKNRLPGRRSC